MKKKTERYNYGEAKKAVIAAGKAAERIKISDQLPTEEKMERAKKILYQANLALTHAEQTVQNSFFLSQKEIMEMHKLYSNLHTIFIQTSKYLDKDDAKKFSERHKAFENKYRALTTEKTSVPIAETMKQAGAAAYEATRLAKDIAALKLSVTPTHNTSARGTFGNVNHDFVSEAEKDLVSKAEELAKQARITVEFANRALDNFQVAKLNARSANDPNLIAATELLHHVGRALFKAAEAYNNTRSAITPEQRNRHFNFQAQSKLFEKEYQAFNQRYEAFMQIKAISRPSLTPQQR